ncbi:MAG: transposase [Thaumarchaeota archaeon]|nr:transposase [Nitrososphaerota archaeon]
MQTRNFKFRLYPNSYQIKKLQENLDACRWVYNKMVEVIHKNGSTSRNDLNYFLTELKQSEHWLYNYHSKMLQMVSTQVAGSQKSLMELHKNGYKTGNLRFAKYDDYHTFTYNQSGFGIIKYGNSDLLHLLKIGSIEIRKHRNVPENAMIKQIIVTKSRSGKWYCSVTCDIDAVPPKTNITKPVGIDVGIKNFAYDSDGFVTPNPLNLQKMLKPLARVQRKISRRQPGSNNRKKSVKWYQLIHERIKNRRKDFLHKLSTQYARKYDIVFVEKLQKMNMVKNHRFARGILDSGWGTFTNMLYYKTILAEIPARNTTVTCSCCGNSVPKSPTVRIHRCDICGLVLDRDHNAAINILSKGLGIFGVKSSLPQELREVTPVEISQRSRKQEKTIELSDGSSLSFFGI